MSEENKNSLFREKSTELMDSPEKLDQYLTVTGPGIWTLLFAIILILAGVCVAGAFIKLENTAWGVVISENGEGKCLVSNITVPDSTGELIVRVGEKKLKLDWSGRKIVTLTGEEADGILYYEDFYMGQAVLEIPLRDTLDDGVYSGEIVIETFSLLSLLLN